MKNLILLLFIGLILSCNRSKTTFHSAPEGEISKVWVADNGDGTYKNPILFADYSDPDVIRADDDYFMISSSFNCVPALPVLHSKDLVNWKIIGNVFTEQKPIDFFNKPQHGNGVWAPSIRYHNNEFYIYYGDPDFGIYMTKAENPAGPWTEPLLVKEGRGWIDPCPFWDENGEAYLIHAWAGSRAGIKSILTLHRMSPDGTKLLDNGIMVFDGHEHHPTVEGPKFYKKNGYYYIFAPAGGVSTGWQLVLRAKDIYGPYEYKIVMHQGNTPVNGPHQGGWVDTKTGEDWFVHFQDMDAYGRVVHLQPMQWVDDWPIIGTDTDKDGVGEPVLTYSKPNVDKQYQICTPQTSDEFNEPITGLQWQWHANPMATWGSPSANLGFFRLNAIPLPEGFTNFWEVPNLFLQKFTAPRFTATARIEFHPSLDGDRTGLIIMGEDYSYISATNRDSNIYVSQTTCFESSKKSPEKHSDSTLISKNTFYLRVSVSDSANCSFSYSVDSINFIPVGTSFTAKPGRWIGAKVGLFCVSERKTNNSGYVNIDWFRIN
jgi:beta-xylosidase